MSLRIAQVLSGRGINGAATHCLALSRALRERGNGVTLICRSGSWIGAQARSAGLEVLDCELRRWPLDDLRRVSAFLADRGVDVVHTHMSRAHFFGVLLKYWARIPVVASAHATFVQLHWCFNDHVIAPTETVRRFHVRFNRVSPERISLVHWFVDTRRFNPSVALQRAVTRSRIGVPASARVVGFVGSVIPRKRLLALVEAMPPLMERIGRAHLVVAGWEDRVYAARVRAASLRLGLADWIHWLGDRDDIPALLGAFDVLALPSGSESCGLVLLEAMACGIPSVATRSAAIAEVVEDGATGLLVPLRDSEALVAALARLLGDSTLRQHLAAKGLAAVRQRHDLAVQAGQIEALLERCVTDARMRGGSQ